MSSEWSVHFLTVTDRNKTVLIEKDVVERYVEEAKSTVSGVTNPFKDGTTTQREMVRKALSDSLAAHGINKRPTAHDKNVVCTMCGSCLNCNSTKLKLHVAGTACADDHPPPLNSSSFARAHRVSIS
jgi:hypothetical protein